MGTSADDVFNFIKDEGPVLPTAVAEKFSMNTLFASAFLSELSSKGRILVSSIKVGGSPLYYLPEQKEKLSEYKDNLHDKEQRTFEMLKSRMVVEDIKLELLDRVALRKMKDYAIALNVTIGFQTRLFWKFFTVTDDIASQIISRILQEEALSLSKQQETQVKEEPVREEVQQPIQPIQSASESVSRHEVETPRTIVEEKTMVEEQRPEQSPIQTPTTESMEEKKPEPVEQETIQQPIKEEDKKKTFHSEARKPQQVQVQKQRQAVIEPYRIEPENIDYYSLLEQDSFGKIVAEYLKNKDIVLIFTEIQKKSSEIFGIMSVPSVIGDLEYFFYAKKKKSVTDKDIKEAYAESLILGYPLLYIAHGKLSKNAITFSDSKLKGCKIIELE